MPTASALLAPAAPVSTGTSAAAVGAETIDAGLFSGKVADALNAGVDGAPVGRMTPGRLAGARSLGVILAHVLTVDPDAVTPTPTTETVSTTLSEIAPPEAQPSLTDEQQNASDATTTDVEAPDVVAATPFEAAQPTPTVPVAQSPVGEGSVANSGDAASAPVEPQAAQDVMSVAFVAPEATTAAEVETAKVPVTPAQPATTTDGSKPTVASRPAVIPTADTAPRPTDVSTSAPAKQEVEAKNALAGSAVQAFLSEFDEIPTTETPASFPVAAKAAAEVETAEVPVTPAQRATASDSLKPAVAPKPAVTVMADAAPRATDTATSEPATFESAASTVQTTAANTDKPAAPSPIAQSLAAVQIPTAQVQIAVTSTTPRPSIVVPAEVVAAIAEATSSLTAEAAETSDQPAEAASVDTPKSPTSLQSATPLRGSLHAVTDQTGDTAVPAVPTVTTEDATPSGAAIEVAAKPAPPSAKATEPAAPAAVTPESAPLDAPTANAMPTDGQTAQQAAASSHAPGLSTLSRATVETTAQLAAQIARKLDGRSTRFDMVLTPEDLGRVDVSLEIGKDGQLSARLAFDNPAAAADLKGRADELRRQLQEAGFQVAGDALDFSQRDPSTGGGAFERQQQRNALFAGGSRLAAQADMPIVPAPGAWINHSLTPDRVDLKV